MRLMNNFYINFLKINLIKYIYSIILKKNKKNYLVIVILTKYIKEFFFFIFKNTFFIGKILNDICVIDNINKLKRFEIIYNITSIKYNYRFIIKSFLNNVFIETITNIYNSANWLERECWDLYGIYFISHPDLRRILTDYGFEGYPFRKDFPINGYIELRFDEEKYLISYEPIQLTQEYRLFNFLSPWENLY
jgi:NADH-quinone oxidoreductase subunit C